MKFCRFCGVECKDDATFCTECGKKLDENNSKEASQEYAYERMINESKNRNMTERNIILVIIFSLITCGIYYIYWAYVTTEELNEEDNSTPDVMNYILALLLSIITCGIFMIYWNYTFYKKADAVTNSNNFLVNFILSILGFSIVSAVLIQSDINKYVE